MLTVLTVYQTVIKTPISSLHPMMPECRRGSSLKYDEGTCAQERSCIHVLNYNSIYSLFTAIC